MNKFFGWIKVSNETKTELNIVETLTKTKQKTSSIELNAIMKVLFCFDILVCKERLWL
jgi:hypothetical protein